MAVLLFHTLLSLVFYWNVRGLGGRVKRLAVLHMVKRLGSSVVCVQETHMSPGQESPFSAKLFGTQFYSAFSSYARGVSVLVGTNVPFACMFSLIDPYGQFIVLLYSLDDLQCIIVNVYILPPSQWKFLKLWLPSCHTTQVFLQLLWVILIII